MLFGEVVDENQSLTGFVLQLRKSWLVLACHLQYNDLKIDFCEEFSQRIILLFIDEQPVAST